MDLKQNEIWQDRFWAQRVVLDSLALSPNYKIIKLSQAKILTYYKQFSDAQDCYKELLVSLDDAKIDVNKKLKLQKEAQKALVNFYRL